MLLVSDLRDQIVGNPSIDKIKKFSLLINPKDAHVIAAADSLEVDYLVTLDKKHFFTDALTRTNLSFQIVLPGDLLSIIRSNLSAGQ